MSETLNLTVNINNQTLKDFWTGGMAGKIYGTRTFKWIDKKIVVTPSESQDYVRVSDMFIKKTKLLLNGELKLNRIDSIPRNEIVH